MCSMWRDGFYKLYEASNVTAGEFNRYSAGQFRFMKTRSQVQNEAKCGSVVYIAMNVIAVGAFVNMAMDQPPDVSVYLHFVAFCLFVCLFSFSNNTVLNIHCIGASTIYFYFIS